MEHVAPDISPAHAGVWVQSQFGQQSVHGRYTASLTFIVSVQVLLHWRTACSESEAQRDWGTEGQGDRGSEGQGDRGSEGQGDRVTEGQRDRGIEGQRVRRTEGQRVRGTE